MPKITIITTTYKHQDFIAQTIESILAQTYTDWELLIGDDSPDSATWNIIQTYVAKYPEKIKARHHKPNKGIVENMNFLINKISPESVYVGFLEGDDIYTPNNIQEKIAVLEKYHDVGLVYSDLSFINKENQIIVKSFFNYRNIPFYQNQTIPKDEFILLPAGPIASRSTIMTKRALLDVYPIRSLEPQNKQYSIADYDLCFHIATTHKVYGIKKQLTKYRRHKNNLSGKSGGTSRDLELLIDVYYKEGLILPNTYKKKKSRIYIVYCIFALEEGSYMKALRYLYHSLKNNFKSFFAWKIACFAALCVPTFVSKYVIGLFIKRG